MYVAAAVCMWVLRAWKIGQIEQIAAEQEKRPEDINAASSEPMGDGAISLAAKRYKSGVLKRLFIWKKV